MVVSDVVGTKEKQLQAVIKRIVETIAPERIILFGSAAKNEIDKANDLDLLVVNNSDQNSRLTGDIYVALHGIERPPVDVIVVTEKEYQRDKNVFGTLIHQAHREGKVVYSKNNE